MAASQMHMTGTAEATVLQMSEHMEELAAAVKRAEEIPAPDTTDIFDYTYAELTPEQRIQRQTMRTSSIGMNPSEIESPQPA